jgi:hypothetical protein
MRGEQQVPAGDVAEGFGEGVASGEAHGGMEDVRAGGFEALKVGLMEGIGLSRPLNPFTVIEREQAQHVDYGGLFYKVQRGGGVFDFAFREEAKAASADKRCTESVCTDSKHIAAADHNSTTEVSSVSYRM